MSTPRARRSRLGRFSAMCPPVSGPSGGTGPTMSSRRCSTPCTPGRAPGYQSSPPSARAREAWPCAAWRSQPRRDSNKPSRGSCWWGTCTATSPWDASSSSASRGSYASRTEEGTDHRAPAIPGIWTRLPKNSSTKPRPSSTALGCFSCRRSTPTVSKTNGGTTATPRTSTATFPISSTIQACRTASTNDSRRRRRSCATANPSTPPPR